MKLWLIVSLMLVVHSTAKQITQATYDQLSELISLSAISYCQSSNGLRLGKLPQACEMKFCQSSDDTEILEIFAPKASEFGASGYIAINHPKKQIFIVFRGSQTQIDWLTDLKFTPQKYIPYTVKQGLASWHCDNCQIHRGFYRAVGFFMETPFKYVNRLLSDHAGYDVVITGHSLGGALALLTALEFQAVGLNPLVVTFGQPKIAATFTFLHKLEEVFNQADNLAQFLESGVMSRGYFRVDHKGDKITLLPPTFLHAGIELFIDKKALPHTAADIKIKSHNAGPVQIESIEAKKWNDALLNDHRNYLRKVPGCEG